MNVSQFGIDFLAMEEYIYQEARKLALTLQPRVLFVDGLLYGPVDFPRDLQLNVGSLLPLAGFGPTVIQQVTECQLWVRRVQLLKEP